MNARSVAWRIEGRPSGREVRRSYVGARSSVRYARGSHLTSGIRFYTDAGLEYTSDAESAAFRCPGQDRNCLVRIGGAPVERLHHIALRADGLDAIAAHVAKAGGAVIARPAGVKDEGLFVRDPHGMLYPLLDHPRDPEPATMPPFEINSPGRLPRKRRSAMLPSAS